MSPPGNRRALAWHAVAVCLLLTATLMTGGCSTLSKATTQTVGLLIHGNRQTLSPTPAKVAARPYYQLEVTSKAGSALLILGNIDHGRQDWYSADDQILFLRHGVMVKTWNMKPDIIATRLPANSPFVTGLQHVKAPVTTTRTLDLPDYRYGVVATSRLVPEGVHDVIILGRVHKLLRIDAHIRAPSVGFKADNCYWVDPASGFIWKSRQTIPGGMTLTLTELRPYRGGAS